MAGPLLTVTSNLDTIVERLGATIEVIPAALAEQRLAASVVIREGVTEVFREHTPYGPEREDEHEHLRDTTESDAIPLGASVLLSWRQTKAIQTKNGPYPLARLLDEGGKGPYDILPINKKALYWPGARHPVRAVYGHPPMPAQHYIAPAWAASQPLILSALAASGVAIGETVLGALRA